MSVVRVRTGARLHFGMLAYGGESQRQFGGAGLMIDSPLLRNEFVVEAAAGDKPHAGADVVAAKLLRSLESRFNLPTLSATAGRDGSVLPQHFGLGSGTQAAVAVAAAAARLAGSPIDAELLSQWSGRGARSAIGVHGFCRGGLLVEGGKGVSTTLAPLVARQTFPTDWPVLLFIPDVPVGLHGDAERRAFAEQVKFPPSVVDSLCRLVLLGLAPAVAERDYAAFGDSVYELNRRVGECFAEAQSGVYAHRRIEAVVDAMRRAGLPAVGQSSWGPTVFAVSPDLDLAEHVAAKIQSQFPDVPFHWARARNRGADLVDSAFVPRLLVSVRSEEEALAAIAGGADIVDVKEPDHGPLGAADPAVVRRIAAVVQSRSPATAVTAALGELHDSERLVADSVPAGMLALAKIGFAGESRRSDWQVRFRAVAAKLAGCVPLIPAVYRDFEAADSPHPVEIVHAAAKLGSPYVLFDTFDKRNVPAAVDAASNEAMKLARTYGMQIALAGSIRAEKLPYLLAIPAERPEVVAIRGAACLDGLRNNAVRAEAVARFRQALHRAAAPVRQA